MLTPFIKGPLSVEALSMHLKTCIRNAFPYVAVYGEISNLRRAQNTTFFTLKDAASQIPVVLFNNTSSTMLPTLANGQLMLIEGRVDVYIASGRYQIVANKIRKLGLGELQQQFEALKMKLKNEGLFDADKKLPLPPLPHTIGVITSPEAAALQDFIHTLQRENWLGSVLLAPALVQGNGAAASIIHAFKQLHKRSDIELIVLIRGGGSFEDLNGFNQETLVRTLATRKKPLLTGIGHEIDYTLCDFVADKRAETPTAAAEWIARTYQSYLQQYQHLSTRFQQTIQFRTSTVQRQVVHLSERLAALKPTQLIITYRERYARYAQSLQAVYQRHLSAKTAQLTQYAEGLKHFKPSTTLQKRSEQLAQLTQQLRTYLQQQYTQQHQRWTQATHLLQMLSLERQLKRGLLIPLARNRTQVQSFSANPKGQWLWHRSGKFFVRIVDKAP